MSQELIKLNINIAGRSYPIKVTSSEELQVRDIEKKINTDILEIQKKYPTKDISDCLSMYIVKLAFDQNNGVPSELINTANTIKELLSYVEI